MMVDPRLDNPGGPSDSGPFQDPDATEPAEPYDGDGVPPDDETGDADTETGDASTEEFDPGVQ